MANNKQRKDRTSICISKDVLERGRNFCSSVQEELSFSVLVERAVTHYLDSVEVEAADE